QPLDRHGALAAEFGNLGLDLEADASFRHYRGREGQADTKLLEDHAHLALVVDDGDRELAAGQKLRGLARDRRQVRLGERANEAIAFQRAQRIGDAFAAARPGASDAAVTERLDIRGLNAIE